MKPIDVFFAILVIALWAGNFVAAKYTLVYLPPFLLSAVRFAITAAILLPFVRMPRGSLKKIYFLSITLGILHFGLIMVGVKTIDASTASIAVQAGVPFSVLLAGLFYKEKLFLYQIIGICVAFAGFFVLMGEPVIFSRLGPFLIVVAAAFFWAVSNLQSRGLREVNGFTLNAYFGLFVAPQLLVLSLIFEDNQIESLVAADLSAFLGLGYTILMSTIVAYGLWYYLLGKYKVNQVAPFNMLSPFFGTIFGILFYNESMSVTKIIGGLIIVFGVSILILYKPKVKLNA